MSATQIAAIFERLLANAYSDWPDGEAGRLTVDGHCDITATESAALSLWWDGEAVSPAREREHC